MRRPDKRSMLRWLRGYEEEVKARLRICEFMNNPKRLRGARKDMAIIKRLEELVREEQ
jgi:hypothetical protein